MEVIAYHVTDEFSFWSFEKARTIINLLDIEKRIDRAWLSELLRDSYELDHDFDIDGGNWANIDF